MTMVCKPPAKHRTAQLYFLKKIHKNPMGIRPIVSSVNGITENISKFLDYWLQPIVRTLPSYLKDSNTFANLIQSTKVPNDCILVSIDVSSLYTNIPHSDGLEAATIALADHMDQDPIRPPIQVLRELMSIVLKNNIFEFNGEFYLQLQGTAMGTKMAPSYANIFMGKLEPQLIAQDPTHIQLWKRYIDDIFIIWTGTNEQLNTFLNKINQIHPTIKFTHECDEQELTFLDMVVYKGPNFNSTSTLDIKTHIKKTNKQLYIHKSSYHPKACKKAVPKGEILRYLRTNSQIETFSSMRNQLIKKLVERGYKARDIKESIKEIKFEGVWGELESKKLSRDNNTQNI